MLTTITLYPLKISPNFYERRKMKFGLKIIVNFEVIKYPERNIFRDNYSVHSESLIGRK